MTEAMEVAATLPIPDDDLEFETSKGVKPINTFDGMKLKQGLIKGIYTFGFEKPSAIQQRAIVPITSGADPAKALPSAIFKKLACLPQWLECRVPSLFAWL